MTDTTTPDVTAPPWHHQRWVRRTALGLLLLVTLFWFYIAWPLIAGSIYLYRREAPRRGPRAAWSLIAVVYGVLFVLAGLGLYVGGVANEPNIRDDSPFEHDFYDKAEQSKNLKAGGLAVGGVGLVLLVIGLATRRSPTSAAGGVNGSAVAPSPGGSFCTACGRALPGASQFCSSCGTAVR